MASAYTSVQTSREGFSDQQPQQSQDSNRSGIEWPQPVRDYVSRAFASENAIDSVSNADMTARLKHIIGNMAQQGVLNSTAWETMPLPQQIIQQERAQAIAQAQAHVQAHAHAAYVAALAHHSATFQANHSESIKSAKKRRLDDSDGSSDTHTPPWMKSKSNHRSGLASRITFDNKTERGDKRQKNSQVFQHESSSKFQDELEQRRRRFDLDNSSSPAKSHHYDTSNENMTMGPVVGTCQTLEKEYFRLTSPPKPSEVRPLPVLKETLKLLRTKWRKEQKYSYICSQFKSLRQDLTVQRIKNAFTVEVYELHARIALEQGDLGEYNQCQTQLRSLYSLNLGGNPSEFLAYRILYFVHTANRTDMNKLLAELTEKDKEDDAVRHALETRSAVASGNYHKLFRLYLSTPNMGAYLMDKFVGRERLLALVKICSAYTGVNAELPLRFITEELGFESDNEAINFIQQYIPEVDKFITTKTVKVTTSVSHGTESSEPRTELFFLSTSKDVRSELAGARAAAFRKIDIKGQI